MRAVNLVFAAIGGCALVVAVDRGKCVLHGVGDSVPIVAPPGQPNRQPRSMTLIKSAHSLKVALADGSQQGRVARAAVHDLTVVTTAPKRFTPARDL
jgi:hypothetical protein